MKVLYLSHGDDTFGAPRSMMKMIEILKDTYGVEPIIITGRKNRINSLCDELGIENYSIRFVNTGRYIKKKDFYFHVKGQIARIVNVIATIKINLFLRTNVVDIIHSNVSVIDIGVRVAKKRGIPHVWHLREILDESNNWNYYWKNNYSLMNNYTDTFIAISNAVKKYWVSRGIKEDMISTIYNGISIDKIPVFDNKNPEDIKFVLVGSIFPHKGQLDVIEAFGKLDSKILSQIHLDIIGEGSSEYVSLIEKRIKELNLQENISLLGFKEDIVLLLGKYDVGFVASKAEAFGRTTIEYMLSGVVVIATDAGANPELIQNGENGFLYKSNDFQDLAYNIEYVVKKYSKLKNIKESAYYNAKQNFSSEKNASEVYEIYKQVIQNKLRT